jgi:hypothetical protein
MTTTTTGSTDTSSYPAPAVWLARMFYDRVAATPRAGAFRFPAATGWASLTCAQTAETAKTPLRTRWSPQQSPWRADRADLLRSRTALVSRGGSCLAG